MGLLRPNYITISSRDSIPTLHLSNNFLASYNVSQHPKYTPSRERNDTLKKDDANENGCINCQNKIQNEELFRIDEDKCESCICLDLSCPCCEENDLGLDNKGAVYKNPDSFIKSMRSMGVPIKTVKNTDISPMSDDIIILQDGCNMVFDRYSAILSGMLALSSLGSLEGNTIEITDLSLEDIESLLSQEELKEGLGSIFNGKTHIEGTIESGYVIKDTMPIPYLPRIRFPYICGINIDTSISPHLIKDMKNIETEQIEHIALFYGSFHILPRINILSSEKTEPLHIDRKGFDITPEIVKEMEDINIGKIKHMNLFNRALFLLKKISNAADDPIGFLNIETKESEIDPQEIREMDSVILGNMKGMALRNKAFYLLQKYQLKKEVK
eukprot:GHVP01034337.1.p1 GENE.GHVP01034337.1~~GHVP01034337.1.p1  ORF type:complete len:385 (-),score=49.02 GHVP01034337.1:5422-6576(-)